jgi:TorA maturation chaperone TorD
VSYSDLARIREATYRACSLSWLAPDRTRWALLAQDVADLIDGSMDLAQLAVYQDWREMLHAVQALDGEPGERARQQYVALFVAAKPAVLCPPFESYFRGDGVAPAGEILAGLGREYREFGMQLASSVSEPPDHIAIELEFMAVLCGHEADGWEDAEQTGNVPSSQEQVQHRQRAFLAGHLGAWLPAFAMTLEAAAPDSVYSRIARGLVQFARHDHDLLQLLQPSPASNDTAQPAGTRVPPHSSPVPVSGQIGRP